MEQEWLVRVTPILFLYLGHTITVHLSRGL